jgi:tRNA G37 N-methylase Trm5
MKEVQKNKGVKTVVNKLKSIDAKFRFFKMELLAGESNYVVEHVGFSIVPSAFAPLKQNLS